MKVAMLLYFTIILVIHEALGTTLKVPGLGKIKGQVQKTAPDGLFGFSKEYESYTGIPYGNIPERFLPATLKEPLTNGDDTFDATKPQVACWQLPSVPVPGPFTEDCLSLNVYVPKGAKDRKLPVIVFLHGGSFTRWSGNMFGGQRLMNRDVVLVSINYRLNVFGFFCTENDHAPGNLGLYDQVLALQWVQKYISHFSGDPSRVTLAGQSAGGAAVTYLLDSPLARGLFHSAISSSGDDLAGWTTQAAPLQNSLNGAAVVGCYNPNATLNLDATLQCMKTLPPNVLLAAMSVFYTAPSVQSFPLSSYPKVTPISPYASLLSTTTHNPVPLMIGSNKNDGSFLLSRIYSSFLAPAGLVNNTEYLRNQFVSDLLKSTSFGMKDIPLGLFDSLIGAYLGNSKRSGRFDDITPGLVDIFSVFYFRAPILTTAKAHSLMANTYVYTFEYQGTQTVYPYLGGVPQVPRGVAHVDDLMYVFFFGDYTNTQDKLLSSMMLDIYTGFATNGDPTASNNWLYQKWPKFTMDEGKFYKINSYPTVSSDYVGSWFGATK